MPGLPVASINGQDIFGCPVRQITETSTYFLKLYEQWEQGVLWCAGGISEQPNIYVQAMIIIGQEVATWRREELENQKRQRPIH